MKIEKVNDSVIRIADIGREESLEISELYRYKVHNYQTMRKNPKFKNWNGDINWASLKDVSKLDGKFLHSTSQKITDLGFKSCSTIVKR